LDRIIVYPGAIPQDTDLLSQSRNVLVGLGSALQDILGSSTICAGLPCTQTAVASLAVLVGAGRIYSLQNIDGTGYGSLAADTTHQIVKQGIQADAVTISTPAPGTAGQSINYLIEASYQDVDSGAVVLPYYNASNPAVPYSGPGGAGTPQNTVRRGGIIVQAKAGTPATTGTQTTPAADAGFVPLYVVTVANGQSTVLAANIAVHGSAPFNSGTFTATLTGCTTSPTGTVKWWRNGNVVTAILPTLTATSNSTSCSLTGLPAILWPTTAQTFGVGALSNNGAFSSPGGIYLDTGGVINLFYAGSSTGFTASGTKGISSPATVSWLLGV
jgi:hypothetical protein